MLLTSCATSLTVVTSAPLVIKGPASHVTRCGADPNMFISAAAMEAFNPRVDPVGLPNIQPEPAAFDVL